METPDPRKASAHQLYFGYPLEHFALLEKYKGESVPPTPGCYTDYFGIRTRLALFGIEATQWYEENSGMPPFPDDSIHAEAIEYLACARAVESCTDSLTVVELGAGWGPWITLCTFMGIRCGLKEIALVAVEADAKKLAAMQTHLTENGLPYNATMRHPSGASVRMKCVHAGVAAKSGTISFAVTEGVDWGGAVTESVAEEDYRGMKVAQVTIPAVTIAEVMQDQDRVDIVHVDIQGAERSAIPAAIEALNRKARFLALGTHSRRIEGELMTLLIENGWKLEYEKPCKLAFKEKVSVEGMTVVDGLQFWINPALS